MISVIEVRKIGLSTLLERKMKDDRIESFKIIIGISYYGRRFLQYLSSNWKLTVKLINLKLRTFLLIE